MSIFGSSSEFRNLPLRIWETEKSLVFKKHVQDVLIERIFKGVPHFSKSLIEQRSIDLISYGVRKGLLSPEQIQKVVRSLKFFLEEQETPNLDAILDTVTETGALGQLANKSQTVPDAEMRSKLEELLYFSSIYDEEEEGSGFLRYLKTLICEIEPPNFSDEEEWVKILSGEVSFKDLETHLVDLLQKTLFTKKNLELHLEKIDLLCFAAGKISEKKTTFKPIFEILRQASARLHELQELREKKEKTLFNSSSQIEYLIAGQQDFSLRYYNELQNLKESFNQLSLQNGQNYNEDIEEVNLMMENMEVALKSSLINEWHHALTLAAESFRQIQGNFTSTNLQVFQRDLDAIKKYKQIYTEFHFDDRRDDVESLKEEHEGLLNQVSQNPSLANMLEVASTANIAPVPVIKKKIQEIVSDAVIKQRDNLLEASKKIEDLQKKTLVLSSSHFIKPYLRSKILQLRLELLSHQQMIETLLHHSPSTKKEEKEWLNKAWKIVNELQNEQMLYEYVKKIADSNFNEFNQDLLIKKFLETTGTSSVVDEKILLHWAGEIFGLETGLEGSDPSSHLEYLQEILKEKIKVLKEKKQQKPLDVGIDNTLSIENEDRFSEKELTKLLKQVGTALSIIKSLTNIDFSCDHLQKLLMDGLECLEEGESIFFPGAIVAKQAGETHTIYYEFIKQVDGRFTVRLYNTDPGSKFHVKTTVGYKEKGLFVELIDIRQDKIIGRPFLQGLRSLLTPLEGNSDWQDEDIYQKLLSFLEGKPSPHEYSEEDLITMQRSGVCSLFALIKTVQQNISDKTKYKQLRYEMRFKSIIDFTEQNKHRLQTEERPRRLLKKTLEGLARLTKKNYKNGVIGEASFIYAVNTIGELFALVNEAERQHLQALEQDAPALELDKPLDSEFSLNRKIYEVGTPSTSSQKIKEHAPIYGDSSMSLQELDYWKPKPEALIPDLENFIKKFQTAKEHKDDLFVVYGFQKIMKIIPLNWEDDTGSNYWENFSESDKQAIVSLINNLAKRAYEGVLHLSATFQDRKKTLEPQAYLAHLKAQTLAHQLMVLSNALPSPLFQVLLKFSNPICCWRYNSNLNLNLVNSEYWQSMPSYVKFYDPIDDNNLLEIQHYWISFNSRHQIQPGNRPQIEKSYIRSIIERSEIQEKLKQRIPNFLDLDLSQQTTLIMADYIEGPDGAIHQNKDIFPSYYYHLNELIELGDAYLTRPLAVKEGERVEFGVLASLKSGRWEDCSLVEGVDLKNRDIYLFGKGEASMYQGKVEVDKQTHLSLAHEPIKGIYTKLGLSGIPEENVTQSPREISLQELRNLCKLAAVYDLEVDQALEFFTSHLSLLSDPDAQSLCKHLLFAPGVLIEELNASKERRDLLEQQLSQFVNQGYHFFKGLDNIEGATFFLHLNEKLQRYVHFARARHGEIPKERFLDTLAEIKSLQNRSDLSVDARFLLCQETVFYYQNKNPLSREDLTEVIESYTYAKIYGANSEYATKENKLALERTVFEMRAPLEEILEGEQRNTVLNRLASKVANEQINCHWLPDPKFPLYKSRDSLFTIDLFAGELLVNNLLPQRFPLNIRKNPTIENFFGKGWNALAVNTSPNVYEFKYQGALYKIINEGQFPIIQRQFNINGKEVWCKYISNDYIKNHINIPSCLFQDNISWISSEKPPEFFLTSSDTKELKFQIETRKPVAVFPIDAQGKLIGVKLANILSNRSPWHFLSRFESLDQILVYADIDSDRVSTISLPRFDLVFEKDSQERMVSRSFPGYFLSKKQWVPTLKEMPHYLVLENHRGEKKVLLARHPFAKKEKHALETLEGGFDLQLSSDKQSRLFSYPITAEGKLRVETNEAGIFFALLSLGQMEYSQAHDLLNKVAITAKAFTQEEIEILEWIALMRSTTKDHDPKAIAIELKAICMLIINYLDKQGPELCSKLDNTLINSLYSSYLNTLGDVGAIALTKDEELLLLERLGIKNDIMLKRLLELDSEQTSKAYASIDIKDRDKEQQPSIKTDFSLQNYPEIKVDIATLVNNRNQMTYHEHLLLRPALGQHFFNGYALVKEEESLSLGRKKEIYKTLTGLEMPSNSKTWKKELAEAFKLMKLSTSSSDELAYIHILETVLKYPDRFPPVADLTRAWDQLNYLEPSRKQEKINFLVLKIEKPIFEIDQEEKTKHVSAAMASSSQPLQRAKARRTSSDQQQIRMQEIPLRGATRDQLLIQSQSNFPMIFHEQLDQIGITIVENPNHQKGISPVDKVVELFSLPLTETADPIFAHEIRKNKTSAENYQQMQVLEETKYHIENETKLRSLEDELETQIREKQFQLFIKQQAILQQANEVSSIMEQHMQSLEMVGEGRKSITMDHLIHLFLEHDPALFLQRNPGLTKEAIPALHEEIANYLIEAIKLQQMQEAHKKLEAINFDSSNENPETQELLKQFVDTVTATQAYDTAEHPEYLVFEYYKGVMLRKDQIEDLDQLHIKAGKIQNPKKLGVVLERIMGAGKTFALMPLLARLITQKRELAFTIVPDDLLHMAAEGMSHSHQIDVFHFNRNTPTDAASLQRILQRLEKAIKERKVVLSSVSGVLSFYLTFVDRLRLHSQNPDLVSLEEISAFRSIFHLFKTKTNIILDEADLILNARKEHHYTVGEIVKPPACELDLIAAVFDVLNDPKVREEIGFEFISEGKIPHFSIYQYTSKVKANIIEGLLTRRFGAEDGKIRAFFDSLVTDPKATHLKEIIIKYLQNEVPASEIDKFIQDREIQDILGLAKGELEVLIPLTCSKEESSNYGTTPESDIAIPFNGSDNPVLQSEFSSVYETTNYTFQKHLKEGVQSSTVEKTLKGLQTDALKELRDQKIINFKQTQAYGVLKKLFGDQFDFPLFNYKPSDIAALVHRINDNWNIKLQFIRKHIISEIKTYSDVISVNPQIFNFLFHKVCGFTGTQWNADTFPEGLETVPSEVIVAKTIGLLIKNSPPIVLEVDNIDPKHFSRDVIQKHFQLQNVSAIIDAAGMIKNISAEKVVRQMLELPCYANKDGGVFFDEKGELRILERGSRDPILLAESKIPLKKRVCLYKQKETTGADVPHDRDAVALVTIGQTTILRDLLQAVWRMRGLDKSQRVIFVIAKESKNHILMTLKTYMGVEYKEPVELTLEMLILFTMFNQMELQGDNNYRSLRHKLLAVLQAEVVKVFLDPSIEITDALFQSVQKLFVTSHQQRPRDLFGNKKEELESLLVVDNDLQAVFNILEEMRQHPVLQVKIDEEEVKQKLQAIAKKALPTLTKTITANPQLTDSEMEVEKQTTKQQEQEIEQQLQVNIVTEEDFPNELPHYNIQFSFNDQHYTQANGFASFASLNQPSLDPFKKVFSENLLGSMNFFPTLLKDRVTQNPLLRMQAFGINQKPISSLLISKHKTTGKVKVVMLDLKDTLKARKLLRSDSPGQTEGDIRLGLYNLVTGFQESGKEPISLEEMESPEIQNLVVEAKFFNGETYYSKEEKPYLETWIRQNGAEHMRELFGRIVAWKQESQQAFPGSVLDRALK